MTTRFDRDGLIDGLRQLVAKLHESDGPIGVRIIGGAALALRYFERESTVDIDARPIGDAERVLATRARRCASSAHACLVD